MRSLPSLGVANPVVVGLVMMGVLVGGLWAAFDLVREMYPESRPNQVAITTVYPGAAPPEIEKGIALRVEEALNDLEHIEKLVTLIQEGRSTTLITLQNQADIDRVVEDTKAALDRIPRSDLPEDAEPPRVDRVEPTMPVITVSLCGDVDEQTLKQEGRRLREDLLRLAGVSDVQLVGIRDAELAVEVTPERLMAYGLSMAHITEAIRGTNLDLPGGQLKTAHQNIAVRTLGADDQAERVAETIVKTLPGGEIVRVRDVGQVIDGLEDQDIRGWFNGKPAVSITAYKTARQDAIDIAGKVQAFVHGKQLRPMTWDLKTRLLNGVGVTTPTQDIYDAAARTPYPDYLEVHVHNNLSRFIAQRLDQLMSSGFWGMVLVFASLLLFLDWRVALWVMVGLVFSMCGCAILMKLVGATLNQISMFGLIIVVGLLVDDAIVVAENIYTRVESGEPPHLAAVRGAQEVSAPVAIAVLTTIAAFLPLLFIDGQIGDFTKVLPVVVMCALSVSLLESLGILPSHLAKWLRVRQRSAEGSAEVGACRHDNSVETGPRGIFQYVLRPYTRVLERLIRERYITLAAAVAALVLACGVIAGDRVPFVFMPKLDSEIMLASLEMPVGTPSEETAAVIQEISAAALQAPEVRSVYAMVGARLNGHNYGVGAANAHSAQAIIELTDVGERERSSEAFVAEMRRSTDRIGGIRALRYESMQGGPGGAEIQIEVSGAEQSDLVQAAGVLKQALRTFDGVEDIVDDHESGRREVQIRLFDSARLLGLSTRAVATEVRAAFYGLTARTLQRDREDVAIRVRYPSDRRRGVHELEDMQIATPSGHIVPIRELASMREHQGLAAIRRVDMQRTVTVSADIDHRRANADQVIASLGGAVQDLRQEFPGIAVRFTGNKRETFKSLASLRVDFVVALVLIYVLLAGLFRSYWQPLIVLSAVPFGLIGAVVGHAVMGCPMTMLSVIGLVAMTGIVVNDSVILVTFVNQARSNGLTVREAVLQGGRRRLRPILLTTLTTILGMAPLMAAQSFQARFLVPMAVSISFGLAFATALTLGVVPALYMISEDVGAVLRSVRGAAIRVVQDCAAPPAVEDGTKR